jgi:hypothetical protein
MQGLSYQRSLNVHLYIKPPIYSLNIMQQKQPHITLLDWRLVISQVRLHAENLDTESAECNPTRAPQETRFHAYIISRPQVLNFILLFALLVLFRERTQPLGWATCATEKSVTSQKNFVHKQISSSSYASLRSSSTICTSLTSTACSAKNKICGPPQKLYSSALWTSLAAMHSQPPQLIMAAPLFTIISRYLTHAWSAFTILQKQPPCIPCNNGE